MSLTVSGKVVLCDGDWSDVCLSPTLSIVSGNREQCDDQQHCGQEKEDSQHLPALLPRGRLGGGSPPGCHHGPDHHPRPPPLLRRPPGQGCQKISCVHAGIRSESVVTPDYRIMLQYAGEIKNRDRIL